MSLLSTLIWEYEKSQNILLLQQSMYNPNQMITRDTFHSSSARNCEKCGKKFFGTYRVIGEVKFVTLCQTCGEEEIAKGKVRGPLIY